MMSCDAVQTLGEKKLSRVLQQLVNGACANSVARTIQEDWGDLPAWGRDRLARELSRLRMAMMNDACCTNSKGTEPTRDCSCLDPLIELQEVVNIQRLRIQRLSEESRKQTKPMHELCKAVEIFASLLVMMQKMRFDRGVDESGLVLTDRERKAREEFATLKQRELLEMMQKAEEIFKKRGIVLPEKPASDLEHHSNSGSDRNLAKQGFGRGNSNRSEFRPLDDLAALAQMMKAQVLELFRKERQQNRYIPQLSKTIKVYGKLLMDLQKMRFEFRPDEYKKVTLSKRERQAAAAEARQRQEDEDNRQIIKAYNEAEEIIARNRERLRQMGSAPQAAPKDTLASGA